MVFAEHSTNPVARVAVIKNFLVKVSLLLLLQVCFFRNCVMLICIFVCYVGAGNIEISNRSTDYRSQISSPTSSFFSVGFQRTLSSQWLSEA